MGAVTYADDITLLSPSVNGLKHMLKVCEQFSHDFDIEFNPGKSKMLLFNATPDFLSSEIEWCGHPYSTW